MTKLRDKVAVVFAANGAIAAAVCQSLAAHRAKVYATGRNVEQLNQLVAAIKKSGGIAEASEVDAMDEDGIDACLKSIAKREGKIDIVFNGIGVRPSANMYGAPSVMLEFGHFMEPIRIHAGSQFLTARTAARYMMATKSPGTIIMLTASLSRLKIPFMAGITSACAAIEGLTRVLASEFGQFGIRVMCVNPTALPETRTIQETTQAISSTMGLTAEQYQQVAGQRFLLGTGPSLNSVAELVVFMASDEGAILNSHIIDADCGTMAVI